MIWGAIVEKLLGGVPKLGEAVVDYYKAKRKLTFDYKLEKLKTKHALQMVKTQHAENERERDADWELIHANAMQHSWKDEWVLILLSVPLILVFIPGPTQEAVLNGFLALGQTPEWYRWLIMLIFTAVYGIRLWRRKVE